MNDIAWARYKALVAAEPGLFMNGADHPIEILTAAQDIERARAAAAERLHRRGMPEDWARPGLFYEDEYFRVLRDPVQFASGDLGMYVRIVPPAAAASSAGAAILPLLGKNRVILLKHYRHATRQWHIEIPRGFAEPGETCEAAARRELEEEIGAETADWHALGQVHTNTGLSSEIVHLFLASVSDWRPEKAKDESAVGIEMSVAECRAKVASGEITDSFTLAAWARAVEMRLLE